MIFLLCSLQFFLSSFLPPPPLELGLWECISKVVLPNKLLQTVTDYSNYFFALMCLLSNWGSANRGWAQLGNPASSWVQLDMYFWYGLHTLLLPAYSFLGTEYRDIRCLWGTFLMALAEAWNCKQKYIILWKPRPTLACCPFCPEAIGQNKLHNQIQRGKETYSTPWDRETVLLPGKDNGFCLKVRWELRVTQLYSHLILKNSHYIDQ